MQSRLGPSSSTGLAWYHYSYPHQLGQESLAMPHQLGQESLAMEWANEIETMLTSPGYSAAQRWRPAREQKHYKPRDRTKSRSPARGLDERLSSAEDSCTMT